MAVPLSSSEGPGSFFGLVAISGAQNAVKFLMPLRPWLGTWLDAATQHHERWDGNGYPRKLAGEQISLSARIVAVADAYDVMTSSRSYKKAWEPEAAREELARCAGTQFDPICVEAFFERIDNINNIHQIFSDD